LTERLLELEGAAVARIEPDGLEVVAPEHVRTALQLPELARLGFGQDMAPGSLRVGLDSDFAERLEGLLGEGGRRVRLAGPDDPQAPGSPDRLLGHALVLDNATCRLRGVERAWTTYMVPTFRYVARSDDRREGLVSFAVNAFTGSVLEEPSRLFEAPLRACGPVSTEVPEMSDEELEKVSARVLLPLLQERLTPFVAGMQRRIRRDTLRLLDYYGRLREESLAKLEKLRTRNDEAAPGEARERQRLESIAREHAAKLEDLGRRYALVVEVECLQTLEIVVPVHRLDVEIRRRKATRRIGLDVNPFTRRLDPPPAEDGLARSSARVVCDGALHLVSRVGHAPCPSCERAYCRACHPGGCPRCGGGGLTPM
jgi:hypothetical protein